MKQPNAKGKIFGDMRSFRRFEDRLLVTLRYCWYGDGASRRPARVSAVAAVLLRLLGLIVARTGPAGKTTTVECIDGLRTPGSGTVSVLGLDGAGDRGEPRLCLGAQLQDS
jgi:hypothetical protein